MPAMTLQVQRGPVKMEPRSRSSPSKSPPFCSSDGKTMSLTEQQIQPIQAENGTEYTLITAPLQSTTGGEVIHQVIQHVPNDQQENIDPQTQVYMLQPFPIAGGDQVTNDQNAQYEQVHILQDQLQGGMAVPLQDGQFQQVLVSTGPDGQQHQIIIQQDITPQLQAQFAQQPPDQTVITSVSQMASAAAANNNANTIQPPVGKGPFPCDICEKIFTKWNQLQRHLRTHEEDKPFRCAHCPSTFNVAENLKLHMATHSEKPVCPECGKRFSRIASLKAHIMLHEREENLMCTECGDEFSLQSQLDRHMAEHRQEQEGTRVYNCRQCAIEFSKHSIYRDHMKQHNKVRTSLSHRTYKRNIDRTGFSHKCSHCGKTFQKPSQLLRHQRIHTGERPYKCTQCDKAFNQKGALQIHMTKHTQHKPHKCDFCPMTFSQKGNLRAHIRRVHSAPKDGDTPVFQCEECSCVFRKLGSLNAHMSRMHSDAVPVIPEIAISLDGQGNRSHIIVADNLQGALEEVQQRTAQTEGKNTPVNPIVIQQLMELEGADAENVQQQINQISQAVGSNLNSDILQQALENSGLSIVPVSAAEGNTAGTTAAAGGTSPAGGNGSDTEGGSAGDAGGGGTTTAITVNKDLNFAQLRTLNILDAATGMVKKHLIRKVNGVRWHQCTYCAKEFKKPSDLVRHIRIHTHEKPYKCTQCFRAFAVKSTLTAHVKTHSGQKDHRCMQCDKLFSTVGSLKVHTRLHTGVKPFECPHCDKKFRTSGHCKSHIASHFKDSLPKKRRRLVKRSSKRDASLPDIPLQEPILITDTGYIQQAPRHSQFYNQYLGEAGSVDRPYKCGYCSRGFKKSSHLKQHVRSHTGEKPYKCTQCLRSFISSGVLKAHIRTHTGEKCYKCVICDATFTTNGSLKRHMSTHSEKRPFMCPYCQRTFKTSVNCKKHMKTHRQELALQALHTESAEKDGEMAADQEVPEPGGEEEHDTVDADPEPEPDQEEPVYSGQAEIQQVELASLQQQALTQDQQLQSLTPGELVTTSGLVEQQDLTGQTIIQDALVSDAQFSSTLNQQVLGSQQVTLQPQQNFTQSLLNIPSQQTFNQLNLNQPQFTLQQSGQSIDVGSLGSLTQTNSVITTNLTSTNMQNILQTREPDMAEASATENEDGGEVQDEPDDPKRTYLCPLCGKGFKKSSHLKQHVRSHTGERPYHCDQCGRQFVSHGVLKAHLKTHTGVKDYVCHVCDASFTTNGSLNRHMVTHSMVMPFKCPLCNETFRTAFLCKKHMKTHRVPPGAEAEPTETDRPRRTRSSVIQITEEQAEQLSKQQPDESLSVSEKLLIESAAEKDRISEVKEPRPEVVDAANDTTAEEVAQESAAGRAYTPHSRNAHSCRFCSKTFRKPSDLVRHLRIHTGEKPFNCPICGRCFTVKSTLDSHLKTHKSSEKKFRCHVCGSNFSTKGSLKVHLRLHTGAKPFKCSHCDLRFRTSGHRKSHIASHFKPAAPKKQRRYATRAHLRVNPQDMETAHVDILNVDPQMLQSLVSSGANQLQVGNQIINIEQPAAPLATAPSVTNVAPAGGGAAATATGATTTATGGQNVLPLSLSLDQLGLSESGLAAQVLQGMDGVQLQLGGGLGQNIQITGLDPSMLTQTIQIDASMLAQLQQGTISLSLQPNIVDPNIIQPADPTAATVNTNSNVIQQIQIQQPQQQQQQQQVSTSVAAADTTQPRNIVIQQLPQQATTANVDNLAQVATQAGILDLNQLIQVGGASTSTSSAAGGSGGAGTTQEQVIHVEVTPAPGTTVTPRPQQPQIIRVQPPQQQRQQVVVCQQQPQEQQQQQEDDAASLSDDDHDTSLAHDTSETQEEQLETPGTTLQLTSADGTSQPFSITMIEPAPQAATGDRVHICPMCNKGFRRASHLKEHVLTHNPAGVNTKPKPTPHVCQTCNKAFNKPSQLERHIRIHTGERPFVCEICKRAFNQKNALQIHLKKHNGDRPFKCAYCEQTFTQKGNLKTHIKRTHHMDMVQTMNITRFGMDGSNETTIAVVQAAPQDGAAAEDGAAAATTTTTAAAGQMEGTDLEGVVHLLAT